MRKIPGDYRLWVIRQKLLDKTGGRFKQKEVSEAAGIGMHAYRRLEKDGGVVTAEQYKALMAYLGGDAVAGLRMPYLSHHEIRQAGSLLSDEAVASTDTFQDFDCSEGNQNGHSNCPIRLLWTDAATNAYIKANCVRSETETNTYFLKVEFDNDDGEYSSNVAIHPQFRIAQRLNRRNSVLRFDLLLINAPHPAQNLGVEVRISDKWLRQWVLMTRVGEHKTFSVGKVAHNEAAERLVSAKVGSAVSWHPCVIPLRKAALERLYKGYSWRPFDTDPAGSPHFEEITGVTLEFGKVRDGIRPRGGRGTVLVSPIVFGAEE